MDSMPHLLAVRTYLVLAVACLLGFGGGVLLATADSPSILFYVLGVLLLGLYVLQALRPGVGVRPFRKDPTEQSRRHELVSPTEESEVEPSTGDEPTRGDEPAMGDEHRNLSVNHGLAGGLLDATEQLERARRTAGQVHNWGRLVSAPIGHEAATRPFAGVG
jgi:uncharacterized membrane protein YfcA